MWHTSPQQRQGLALVVLAALATVLGLAIHGLVREHDPPRGDRGAISAGLLATGADPQEMRIRRLLVTVVFHGCGRPVRISLLGFPPPAARPERVVVAATDIRPGSISPSGAMTLTPGGLGRTRLDLSPGPMWEATTSAVEVMEGRLTAEASGHRILATTMWADWTQPAGWRRCYLRLPSVITGQPGTGVMDATGRDRWARAQVPLRARIRIAGLPERAVHIDMGASGNPPRSASTPEWNCRSLLDEERRYQRRDEDTCAGWVVVREAGAANLPSLIFLLSTAFGVLLALLSEVALAAWSAGRTPP